MKKTYTCYNIMKQALVESLGIEKWGGCSTWRVGERWSGRSPKEESSQHTFKGEHNNASCSDTAHLQSFGSSEGLNIFRK